MLCPNCHTDNRANAKFCDECGCELPTVAPLVREMFGEGDTSRLDDGRTRDLQGIDQYTDSSHDPYSAAYVDEGLAYDDPNITQAFVTPGSLQKRAFFADGAQAGAVPPSSTGAFAAQSAPPKPPSNASRKAKAALISLLCAVVVVAAAAGVTYSLQLWGGKVVPDVVSMYADEAASTLEADGFSVERVQVKSDEPEDVVLSTNPVPGTRVDAGSVVTIEVSVARVVPNIVGKSLDEAMKLLAAEGFTNIETVEVKSNEAEGTVTNVAPVAGTRSKADAKITVEAAVPYRVPDVHGMSQEEATAALENEGYSVKVAYVYDEEVPEGAAVGTDPAAGEVLASGSQVTLNLAKHRSTELVSLTRAWLKDSSKVRIGGQDYEISEVNDVSYSGGNSCSYTITARKFETHSWFGFESETRYGNYETVKGTISWNDSNEMSGSDPRIERI